MRVTQSDGQRQSWVESGRSTVQNQASQTMMNINLYEILFSVKRRPSKKSRNYDRFTPRHSEGGGSSETAIESR